MPAEARPAPAAPARWPRRYAGVPRLGRQSPAHCDRRSALAQKGRTSYLRRGDAGCRGHLDRIGRWLRLGGRPALLVGGCRKTIFEGAADAGPFCPGAFICDVAWFLSFSVFHGDAAGCSTEPAELSSNIAGRPATRMPRNLQTARSREGADQSQCRLPSSSGISRTRLGYVAVD